MPNHVHLLLRIEAENDSETVPTISRVIQQMKGYITKQAGLAIWQEKSYDHVIRNRNDYLACREYITNNPSNWILRKDEYYDL